MMQGGRRQRTIGGAPAGVRGAFFLLPCVVAFVLAAASDARAEIVFFATGRTMSIRTHRVDGDNYVFVLRDGGEMMCARTLVSEIGPDEVPYPEPESATAVPPKADEPPAPLLAARPFAELISSVSASNGIDARLVHAIVQVESNYEPRARSSKGAKGLMQLMPATARQYDVRDPYDPKTNLEAGVRHLKDLLSRFDLTLALAAYNAGEAVVRKYGGIPPYSETRSYVREVLARIGQ